MRQLFLSLSLFLLFSKIYNQSTISNLYRPQKCVNLRLREVPYPLQKTIKGENYMNARVHDRLRLIFKCQFRMTCVLFNTATNTSKILTADGTAVDFYLEESLLGQVRCTRMNSATVLYSFHLFVEQGHGKFFKSMKVVTLKNGNVLVACLGERYSQDVKLKINGEYKNAVYNPLEGFRINSSNVYMSTFYQCEKGSELEGLTYPIQNHPELKERFTMLRESYFFRTELSCVIGEYDFHHSHEFRVILACPNATSCPTLTQQSAGNGKTVFSASFPKKLDIREEDYYCVFLKGEAVVANAYFEKQPDHTVFIVSLICIVLLVTVMLLSGKSIYKSTFQKLKKNNSLHKFQEEELLLKDSETIGEGNSSVIHKVKISSTGRPVVIKYSKDCSEFLKEIKFLKSLRHVNIVSALGTAVLPIQKMCYKLNVEHIVLPYYPQKSLEIFIKKFYPVRKFEDAGQFIYRSNDKEEQITAFDLISIGWQVSKALVYLKEMNITHRDVAMRNILIGDNKIIKLADFERAKHGETTKISSAKRFTAKFKKVKKAKNLPLFDYPIEAINGFYFYSSEVFSFGNLLLELFQFGCIAKQSPESYILRLEQQPCQPIECPNLIHELIVSSMQFDYKKRPAIERCEGILSTILNDLSEYKYQRLKQTMIDEDRASLLPERPFLLPSPTDTIDDNYPPLPDEIMKLLTPVSP